MRDFNTRMSVDTADSHAQERDLNILKLTAAKNIPNQTAFLHTTNLQLRKMQTTCNKNCPPSPFPY